MDAARAGSQKVASRAPNLGQSQNKPHIFARADAPAASSRYGICSRLPVAAPREQNHEALLRPKVEPATEFVPSERRLHDARQWVPDEGRWDAVFAAKKGLLEGEIQSRRFRSRRMARTVPAATPNACGAIKMDHRYPPRAISRQAQMEIGRVRQTARHPGVPRGPRAPAAKFAVNPRMCAALDDADHGERARIDDRAHSGRLHPRPGASEKFGLGMAGLQGLHHARSVGIPEASPADNENAHCSV